MLGTRQKQPLEVIDVDIDYTTAFSDSGGDTISTFTAAIASGNDGGADDLVLGPGSLPETALVSSLIGKVWIGGGVSGVTYKITVTMLAASGRKWEHDFRVKVKEE